jgi:acyl-coenzyme A synthetase/AMP-(fatty) acid ligase
LAWSGKAARENFTGPLPRNATGKIQKVELRKQYVATFQAAI